MRCAKTKRSFWQCIPLSMLTVCVGCNSTDSPPPDELTGREVSPNLSLVGIEAGTFTFGSPEDTPCRAAYNEDEIRVTLTRPFLIAATEVTQTQWEALDLPHSSWSKGADKPVTLINFFEAALWCNKLSKLEGLEPCYNLDNCRNPVGNGCVIKGDWTGQACSDPDEQPIFTCSGSIHRYPDRYSCPGYRLPTNAEWEYAAKADVTETHTYGGDLHADLEFMSCSEQPALDDIAWYCHNSSEEPHVVGQKLPNPWGLYDMLGNVEEWTGSFYGPLRKDFSTAPITNPIGTNYDGTIEVRGWYYLSQGCSARPSKRSFREPTARYYITGFRPVRTIFE